MIRNIVFDFGNVILNGNPPTIIMQFAKNEEEYWRDKLIRLILNLLYN